MTIRLCLLFCLLPALAAAVTVQVNISGFSFVNNDITIAVGDTVQWNSLGTGHNVAQSSGAASNAYDGSGFYSGPTCCSGPSSFSFQFNTAGDFYYVCEAHAAGLNMKGVVRVANPSPSPTPCATPSPSPTASATPTASPSATPSATPSFSASETPNPSFSPSDSPSESPSFTASPSFSATATPTASPTASPSFSPSPTLTASASASPSATASPFVTPTDTHTPGGLSFAGVESAGLLASPIAGGLLRYWARLEGSPDAVELSVYSSAFTLLERRALSPGGGLRRWSVPLNGLAAQPVWIQLRVRQDGRWRNGPTVRSYLLP